MQASCGDLKLSNTRDSMMSSSLDARLRVIASLTLLRLVLVASANPSGVSPLALPPLPWAAAAVLRGNNTSGAGVWPFASFLGVGSKVQALRSGGGRAVALSRGQQYQPFDANSGYADGYASEVNEFLAQTATTVPPSPPLAPNPNLLWVEQTAPPIPTTAPPWEQCFGCNCMVPFPDGILQGGSISNKYTCVGGAATARVPEFRWASAPGINPGASLPGKDGKPCASCQSYAVVMDDLDYPNGVGESSNTIKNVFWAVNIPGTSTELTHAAAFAKDSTIVVSSDSKPPCPSKGTHRFKVTLWALNAYMGTGFNPMSATTPISEIRAKISSMELAQASFTGTVKSPGGWPRTTSFLQRAEDWLANEV